MPRKNYCKETISWKPLLFASMLLLSALPGSSFGSGAQAVGESLSGYYAREGNGGSPAEAAGNNIYIRFFPEQWVAMLFLPYPYAKQVDSATIVAVFDAARARTDSSSYLRGSFDLLEQKATLSIERYGYLEDRVLFECGSLAPCTIRMGEGYLDLIKPGMINEHIIRYLHIAAD
jgi:hypothetical protein